VSDHPTSDEMPLWLRQVLHRQRVRDAWWSGLLWGGGTLFGTLTQPPWFYAILCGVLLAAGLRWSADLNKPVQS
jgi:hypothetical protein